jgi:hypothetical protein
MREKDMRDELGVMSLSRAAVVNFPVLNGAPLPQICNLRQWILNPVVFITSLRVGGGM